MNTITHDFEKLEIPILAKLFVVYESAHRLIFTMPKYERYTLGEKIEKTILDIFELIVITNSSSKFEKEKYLLRANSKIEILKLLYQMTLNCKMIEPRKFLDLEKDIIECGKMTQGWIKYTRNLK